MFIERKPYVTETVIFWMDENTPAPAIVVKVLDPYEKETNNLLRPFLNLTVFRPEDGKPWARLQVPAVHDEGMGPSKAHRYSLIGEYDELLPQ